MNWERQRGVISLGNLALYCYGNGGNVWLYLCQKAWLDL